MPQTVEVRFKGTRRDFFLWPDQREPLRLREAVVVESERGQDLGRVHTVGMAAEKKCGGGCTSCEVGAGIHESRTGGQLVEPLPEDLDRPVTPAETPPPQPPGEPATEAPLPEAAPPPQAEPATTPAAARFRSIIRRATQEDIRQANDLRRSEEDARRQVMEKVRHHKLDMKVSDTEWQWDKAKLTIFFTAEKRVDFRALVRDLAGMFRTRIELRQIGVRDEAARLTGVGRCGREYCCSTWLTDLSPVSLALAKDQHLSLNPAQISGGCGRLLCCLKYEHEFYVAARKRFPREGKTLQTAVGAEKVVAVDIFRERVFLRHEEHGPRIIPLVQLRDELDAAGPVPPGPTAGPEGPRPGQRSRPESSGPRREARQSPGRRAGSAVPRTQPDATARPAAPVPPTPPPQSPAAAPADTPPGSPPPGRRHRRRRRGRRGRGPDNPPGPPAPPEA